MPQLAVAVYMGEKNSYCAEKTRGGGESRQKMQNFFMS